MATSAYRLQKTLCGAPADFASFELGFGVRTPQQLVRRVNGCTTGCLQTGDAAYRGSLRDLRREGDARFYETLALLEAESKPQEAGILARLVQGPLSDALTHTGQLTLLRRPAGTPVAGENFMKADIRRGRTGPEASPETEL